MSKAEGGKGCVKIRKEENEFFISIYLIQGTEAKGKIDDANDKEKIYSQFSDS